MTDPLNTEIRDAASPSPLSRRDPSIGKPQLCILFGRRPMEGMPKSGAMQRVGRPTASRLRDLSVDQRGSVVVFFAFGLVVMAAAAMIGIDSGWAAVRQQRLEMAADVAALAAVSRLPDAAAAKKTALTYIKKNMPEDENGKVLAPDDFEVGNWDTTTRTFTPVSGGAVPTAVRVTTRLATANGNAAKTFFAGLFGTETVDLSATAVAGFGGPPCVMALDPVKSSAMLLDSNAEVVAIGCNVQVNSTANSALRVDSNGSLEAISICVGGSAWLSGSSSVNVEPNEYCPGKSDPMASLEPPAIGGCNHHNARYVDSVEVLLPGVYCNGLEIDADSDITLSAGTYIIKDGPFKVLSNSVITGSDVTIFLTGTDGLLFFDSNSSIALTAPTSGAFAGILFFQDRDFGGIHEWNGNSTTTLRGVIYFPSGRLFSVSLNKITPLHSCTVLIASALEFNSNSGVSIDVTSADCRRALPDPYQRGIVLLQ